MEDIRNPTINEMKDQTADKFITVDEQNKQSQCEICDKVFTVVTRTNGMWKCTNRKISCCSLDTNDPKMIDTSFESPKCKLLYETSNIPKTVRLLEF